MNDPGMSLVASLVAPPKTADRGTPCPVAILLGRLPADERDALNTALVSDSGWEHSALARVLTSQGHPIKSGQVGWHRRGDCRCAK